MSPTWFDATNAIGQLLTGISTATAVSVTGWQYFQQKRKNEFEIASELVKELDSNELLRFSVLCIDWGYGLLPVPSHWRPIVRGPAIEHDIACMWNALRIELTMEVAQSPKAMLYRHAFVALFNHLENIWLHLEEKSIRIQDLRNLSWLTKQLWSWSYAGGYDPHEFFMKAAAEWYEQHRLVHLINALRVL
jgi:hypothetical protein